MGLEFAESEFGMPQGDSMASPALGQDQRDVRRVSEFGSEQGRTAVLLGKIPSRTSHAQAESGKD